MVGAKQGLQKLGRWRGLGAGDWREDGGDKGRGLRRSGWGRHHWLSTGVPPSGLAFLGPDWVGVDSALLELGLVGL